MPTAKDGLHVAPLAAAQGLVTGLPRHWPELDGLRGLAILLVLLTHFADNLRSGNTWVAGALQVAQAGWCGVDLFFVLSGFLITGILWDARGSAHYFRNFYARRILRVFPLYYGTLFVLFVVLPAIRPVLAGVPVLGAMAADLSHRLDPARAWGTGWLWLHAANVLTSLKGWVFPEHFWSLAVEEHFYLFWPLVVGRLRRGWLMALALGLALAAVGLRLGLVARGACVSAYVLTPCRMDALALGAFLALAVRGSGGLPALRPAARVVLGASGALWLVLAVRARGWVQYSPSTQTIGYSINAAFFGALLILVLDPKPQGLPARVFRALALRFFGKYSYGLYVLHVLPACLLPRYFALAGTRGASGLTRVLLGSWAGSAAVASPGARVADALLYGAAALGLSVALAWVSWHGFERWLLGLKRYFAYEPSGRSPTALHLPGWAHSRVPEPPAVRGAGRARGALGLARAARLARSGEEARPHGGARGPQAAAAKTGAAARR